jgi:hypothetical protein
VSYVTLRGRWCYNIVLNVHAQTQDKSDEQSRTNLVMAENGVLITNSHSILSRWKITAVSC